MGQQPNIELDAADLPSQSLERGVERRWTPTRPGEISSPSDVPSGASFGRPGSDPGWTFRLLARTSYDRGTRPRQLDALLSAIAGARAASLRRGPVPQDVEVALSIVGLRGDGIEEASMTHLAALRERWLDAIAHEPSPGAAALAAIPEAILADTPTRIRARLDAQPQLLG